MTNDTHPEAANWNRNGFFGPIVRVWNTSANWAAAGPACGPGWEILPTPADLATESGMARPTGNADCVLVDSCDLAVVPVDYVRRAGLPMVLALRAGEVRAEYLDEADGFVFADDDVATLGGVFARAVRPESGLMVRDLSDGAANTINALSAEAGRIAEALAKLAQAERNPVADAQPIGAPLIRRIIRSRRDRDRFFPAEIFADPAWDMLLDLAAARLEGKHVPVSSLCIAAAVPTTTALRWIRSLTEAGLFERQVDRNDARRTYISLSPGAAEAMMAYLRGFASQFSLR